MSLNLTYAIGAGHNRTHVRQDFDDITAWANSLDETDLSSSSGLFAGYRLLSEAQGMVIGSANAGPGNFYFAVGSSALNTSGVSTAGAPRAIYFDDADYTMSGKTQKLRVRAQCFVNGTAPAITLTVGLYPISSASGANPGVLTVGLGTVVSGSTVAFAAPAANSVNQANSGDFTIPADGSYALGVNLSGAQSGNTGTALAAQLQTRWV